MFAGLSLGDFYGIDSFIDLMILFVSILISYQSRKIYNLIKQNRYRFFSWSFGLIAAGFLFKIVSNLTNLYVTAITEPNFLHLLSELETMEIIHFLSFTFYKIFLLAGFLTLFLLLRKDTKKEETFLFAYLGLISVLFSIYFNFVFYLTLIIIVFYVTRYFYRNYKENSSQNSFLVFLGFIFVLVSQFIYMFYELNSIIYLLAEVTIFIGFLMLLFNHTSVKNGKKKNKARGHSRSSRSFKKE